MITTILLNKTWGMDFWCSFVIVDGKEYIGVDTTPEKSVVRMFEMMRIRNKVRVNE